MPELFSPEWAGNFKNLWNGKEGISSDLARVGFSSVIGFGLDNEEKPRVVLTVSNGELLSVEGHKGEKLNWDLRAGADEWVSLLTKPPGLMKLGLAYTTRKLKFRTGDYAAMIKDPSLSASFVKCFALMAKAVR